ncbi:serine hydrolase domain-containing protein [Streptomyces phytophilus]|uniref:serine hydrolase domain-containing protein n=1 Tax=Streptomyces phytophilus TaxID=722715 RepID=UPI0015F0B50A|nr:serine hydrolase domain-containing protein [Streptomyces phytophilus]
MNRTWTRPRTAARRAGAAALLAAVVAGAVGAAAPGAAARGAEGALDPVQSRLDALVERDGVPGALAYDGRTTRTAGVADTATGRPMVGAEGRYRMASNTKAFTATAVMRLVAAGGVRLDAPAARYVPQLAGTGVTVRQLLKQTSGLPEYLQFVDWSRGATEEEYLALALDHPADFEPGARWGYSNTNYLALGLLIKHVTGEDYRTYIERTLIGPLHLKDTYWPAKDELAIRGPHARNYGVSPVDPGAGVTDVTELPGYEFGASGGLVTTPKDQNAFWNALFGGRLLPGWALRAMTHDTTDVGGQDTYPEGSRYGYGVASFPLSCGGAYWGHGGDLPGGSVAGGRADRGRGTVTVYTTTWAAEGDRLADLQGAADAALCAKDRTDRGR